MVCQPTKTNTKRTTYSYISIISVTPLWRTVTPYSRRHYHIARPLSSAPSQQPHAEPTNNDLSISDASRAQPVSR